MPMDRNDFLNAIIDDGIHEIEANYTRLDQQEKRNGGVAGFKACRGKSNQELLDLKDSADQDAKRATGEKYWYYRYFQLQVEWVLNVLSAGLRGQGQEPLTDFTMRGFLKAADILGIKEPT